jgi:hypothetical protein
MELLIKNFYFMSTTNSKLDLFALKSFVSVLPETKREIALRIVGGGGGDPPPSPVGFPYPSEEYYDWRDWWESHDHITYVWYGNDGIIFNAVAVPIQPPEPPRPPGEGGECDIPLVDPPEADPEDPPTPEDTKPEEPIGPPPPPTEDPEPWPPPPDYYV